MKTVNAGGSAERDLLIELCRAWAMGQNPVVPSKTCLDWSALLALAARQKILAMVCDCLCRSPVSEDLRVHQMLTVFADLREASRQRTHRQVEEAERIQAAMNEEGIMVAWRKGMAFNETIYAGSCLRRSNDIDLFLLPDAAAAAASVMVRLGFYHGRYNAASMTIEATPRSETLIYSLYPDHLPPFVRLVSAPFLTHVRADISLQLGWHAAAFADEARELLVHYMAEARPLPGRTLRILSPTANFLDCCLHLYRELHLKSATSHRNGGLGTNLQKLLDVTLLANQLDLTQAEDLGHILDAIHPLRDVVASTIHLCNSIIGVRAEVCDVLCRHGASPNPDRETMLAAEALIW